MTKARDVRGNPDFFESQVESDLPWSRGEQVFSSKDVSHPHKGIVHRIHECVERFPSRSNNHEVCRGTLRERNLTPDKVIETEVLIGYAKPICGLASLIPIRLLLGIGELALVVVIPLLRVTTERLIPRSHLVRGDVALIQVPRLNQPTN